MSKRATHFVGGSGLVKTYPPGQASVLLEKTGRALLKGYQQLAAVEVPNELKAPVADWVNFVRASGLRYVKAGEAVARGRATKARHLLRGLTVPVEVERTEVALDFNWCRIDPKRWVIPFADRLAPPE
jgi:hypothetical protein